MTKKNENRVWFMFVLSVLGFGMGMIIWTITKSISMPVQESNNFMLKYQMADMNINDILKAKKRFNKKYKIELQNKTFLKLDYKQQNIHSKLSQKIPIKLQQGENSFSYKITTKEGKIISDANVTFLLTRPHSREFDKLQTDVSFSNGSYQTKIVKINKAGRYTLQVKAFVENTLGYI